MVISSSALEYKLLLNWSSSKQLISKFTEQAYEYLVHLLAKVIVCGVCGVRCYLMDLWLKSHFGDKISQLLCHHIPSIPGWFTKFKLRSCTCLLSLFVNVSFLHEFVVFCSNLYEDLKKSLSITINFKLIRICLNSSSKRKEIGSWPSCLVEAKANLFSCNISQLVSRLWSNGQSTKPRRCGIQILTLMAVSVIWTSQPKYLVSLCHRLH